MRLTLTAQSFGRAVRIYGPLGFSVGVVHDTFCCGHYV